MQSPCVKEKLSCQTSISHPPSRDDNCHSASELVYQRESFNNRLQRFHSSCDHRRTKHRHKSSESLVSDYAPALFDPLSQLAGSIGFLIVLSMVAGKFFNDLETQIISVRLVDDNLWRNTKCFAYDILRIVVVVQNALDKCNVEAVVRERQLVGVADEKLHRATFLICIRHRDGVTSRVKTDHGSWLGSIPKPNCVEAIATTNIHDRTIA